MKGWIFGSAKQSSWSQQIYKHKNKFQNPLRQNYKHVKTMQTLLELNDNQIHSVIVFVGNSTFKTKMPDNVTKGGGYLRFIKSKTDEVLNEEEVQSIVARIEAGRLVQSFKTNREHVKHVKSIVDGKESKRDGFLPSQEKRDEVKSEASAQSCPKCSGNMLLRVAKTGKNKGNKFWGCSQYPSCRGIVHEGHKGTHTKQTEIN